MIRDHEDNVYPFLREGRQFVDEFSDALNSFPQLAVPASSDRGYKQSLYRNIEGLNNPKTCAKEDPTC